MEVFAMPLEAIKSQTRRFASPRKFILLLASLAAALICLCQTFNLYNSSSKSLGVADKIYVISLRSRYRRREDMEKLRLSLQLHWTYVDALDANSPLVSQIMDWVNALRTGPPHILDEANITHVSTKLLPDTITFAWPGDIETLVRSKDKLDLWSTGVWPSPITSFLKSTPYPPVACATKNYSLTKYTAKEHLILTHPRVACWHSHLSVIHDIVNNGFGVSIILEDDVDMEQDIQKQLAYMWPTLPADWDILFLGIFSSHTD
jgi:GR25 family glycosyltransferase involved in LPS biosynthesis